MTTLQRRSFVGTTLALVLGLLVSGAPVSAQRGGLKTNTRILYHDGVVMPFGSNVYFVYYGCWGANACVPGSGQSTMGIVTDFIISLGGSPIAMINSMYPDATGQGPTGGITYGGAGLDAYSRGPSLTDADVQAVVLNQISTGQLPMDSRGIYIVLASADVAADGFCTNFAQYHNYFVTIGIGVKYAFIGNPRRCPLPAAPQFVAPNGALLPTPNDDFAADGIVTSMLHAISGSLTNPYLNAWFDRYGLEVSDKCVGTFGPTYTTANGAQANMRLGVRDFLIQQLWVNTTRGYCGLSLP